MIDKFIDYCNKKIKAMTELQLEKAYDGYITITIFDKSLHIPFDAISYNAIIKALFEIEEEL